MNLTCLILHELSYRNCVRLSFHDPLILNFRSSTLLYMKIRTQSFVDCLYLLDGRFNQLRSLIIDLAKLYHTDDVENQVRFVQRNLFLYNKQLFLLG